VVITGAATIRDARAGDITLAENDRFAKDLESCEAAAILVPSDFQPERIPRVVVHSVHQAFAKIVARFRPQRVPPAIGVSPAAHISPTAKIGPGANIYPAAVIGDEVDIGAKVTVHPGVCIMAGCTIGEETILFPNVVLYENTKLGRRSIIHAGAVIGAYGFGYDTVNGRHMRGAQLGNVEIGDDVEIGACTTIDRGTYGPTSIGDGAKIDNNVMIAHNCRIGKHNIICGHVALAGSCTTGDYVVMAGQVGVSDHVGIGQGATLGAKAGVMNDVPAGAVYVGIPATPVREQMIKQAALSKLPAMRKQLYALQRAVDRLVRQAEEAATKETV
jgi:UDP-3-O-[3-hydroxymyristoyl] glucosamine N-acyltransferase